MHIARIYLLYVEMKTLMIHGYNREFSVVSNKIGRIMMEWYEKNILKKWYEKNILKKQYEKNNDIYFFTI